MKNKHEMFAEVRNDYLCESISKDEGDTLAYITIDCWKTDNDNEEGEVVATVILTKHHDICVVWHNNGARGDEVVLENIEDAKARLKLLYEGE